MLVSDFDFELPEELIAQSPPVERDGARMLAVGRASGAIQDKMFRDLPGLLRKGDVLVLNDSRVIPARLFATRSGERSQGQAPTGRIEVLLTQQIERDTWRALVRPGRKVHRGERLTFSAGDEEVLRATVLEEGEFGERVLEFKHTSDFFARLDQVGHVPLPPYMHREDQLSDRERYQTVYAGSPGSAAAPTAGLHFTPRVLEEIAARGVEITRVTLHVGLGTFQPVRVERIDEIQLHSEHYTLSEETAAVVNAAKREGRRVIAAGTTTVRTLEHCASIVSGGDLEPHSGDTRIFISPGFRFQVVDALLTNFHLPQSTLLMLVSAFAGRENVLQAYRHAVKEQYRFFSYGDCMFLA